MGFGGGSNEPPKAEPAADNIAFGFGGADPGAASGNNIFGNFGSNINPAANEETNKFGAYDSYTDPFADSGPGDAGNNAGNNEKKNDGGLFDFM